MAVEVLILIDEEVSEVDVDEASIMRLIWWRLRGLIGNARVLSLVHHSTQAASLHPSRPTDYTFKSTPTDQEFASQINSVRTGVKKRVAHRFRLWITVFN